MFAAILASTESKNARKILKKPIGNALIFTVGAKVSRRRLEKAIKPFNGEVIFAKNVESRGILPFDTAGFKQRLLFESFAEYVLGERGCGLKIGIFDPKADHLKSEYLPRLIAHTEETVIITEQSIDFLCEEWLSATGVCPEVSERPGDLVDCDICFAPSGIATTGALFGRGGRGYNTIKIIAQTPEEYRFLVAQGIDPAELLCMCQMTDNRQRISEIM